MHSRMAAEACYERGLLKKQMRMFQSAIEEFQTAALNPSFTGKAHVQVALCLKAAGQHEEAVTAFRQAATDPALSPDDRLHIFYHLGRTLESLGRYADSLEAYGRVRQEDPEFQDVARRIRHLSSGKGGPVPQASGSWQAWMTTILKPQVAALFEQTGQWWTGQTASSKNKRTSRNSQANVRGTMSPCPRPGGPVNGRVQPAFKKHTIEHRRHVRVPIRLDSYFTVKGRTVGGKGELRDLSPWGCRVASSMDFPVGADVQCCIYPQNATTAFVIEGATVRWIGQKEFGLSFTSVRPVVRQQIAQLCQAHAA
ncbi:MAG: tetratricopeptide repeat protein [Nitrospira sp.]|nr:tetratricopeptide repeat protein [Nitrospira sp.]